MAHWHRQAGKYVFVFAVKNGKNTKLSRKLTKHLDAQPDFNVQAWVDEWERNHGKPKAPKDTITDAKWLRLVEEYIAYLETRKKARGTRQWHRQMLLDYCLPFFINHEPILNDPDQWPGKSIKLIEHLKGREATESTLLRANTALRGFWAWLSDEGYVTNGMQIRLRRPVVTQKVTPLQYTVTPDEVLRFATMTANKELRLMALLGYFFSLRPFEIFALRPIDFRAGKITSDLECCQAMKRFQQYDKLAVNIHRQRVQMGEFDEPKASSKGWVACFNEHAARLLVETIKSFEKDKLFFKVLPDSCLGRWKKKGLPGVSLKDLRRASLYYLGHKTSFELIPLKHHARHARVETTMLYLRRPAEDVAEWQELDLDA